MESDERYFGRRAQEELAAAKRAVTPAARDRRMQLAQAFFQRLEARAAFDRACGPTSQPRREKLSENA
jgi:hypothetical protein